MMTPMEILEVIAAYNDGKEIEFWNGKAWCDCTCPLWNFEEFAYRVKQKEKVLYQYLYSDGLKPSQYRASTRFYTSIEEAQSNLTPPLRVLHKLDYTKTIIKE